MNTKALKEYNICKRGLKLPKLMEKEHQTSKSVGPVQICWSVIAVTFLHDPLLVVNLPINLAVNLPVQHPINTLPPPLIDPQTAVTGLRVYLMAKTTMNHLLVVRRKSILKF
mmetsp:Transcript_10144/g.18518  ORF Transcript_10144/g.18518 Transcript_10144/m.18518 type:complete len:112 (-) Transcript_10144:204-539(-)